MGISFYLCFALVSFAVNAAAQFSQVTQIVSGRPAEYVAGPSTSSVAAPAFTPTLVYNCYYMPLICENVANYAKSIDNSLGGDLAAPRLFHFDPSTSSLESRRQRACGCFKHDDCDTKTSNGKSDGTKVTDIAKRAPFDTLNTPMSPKDMDIILAGVNPSTGKTREKFPSVPGRFFGVDGVAFSCDEFPAATFIEGGTGIGGNGNIAKTICAMQSWQIYKAANAVGKWPLTGSAQRREQDWQGSAHGLLRNAFDIGSSRNKRGWGTVYPFSFTTTTLPPQEQTKAYVVRAAKVTSAVMKRDGTPTTSTYFTTTTVGVFDDGTSELRRRDYEADKSSQYGDGEEKIGSAVPRFRVRQALEPAQTSTSRPSNTIASNQTSSMTTAPGLSSSSAIFHLTNSSISMSLSNSTASSVTPSTLYTIQVSSSSGNNSRTNIGSSSLSMVSPSATPSSTRASGSSLTETLLSATTLATQGSTVSTNRSASGSYIVASGAKNTFGTSPSASGFANTASPATSTITSSSSASFSGTSSGVSAASTIQSPGALVAGSPAATSSASAVSSNVASASSAAAALAADPSNKQKAQTAQKQTHDAENAAAALLSLAIRGSPLASALSSLVDSLGTAAAKADAAVDANTPAEVSAAVADLVSDLGDAAKDAEKVKEESEDDDDEPSTSPSATVPSQSQTSQASQTTRSSQTNPSSITSSASLTISSLGSLSSSASSQSNSSISTQTSASAQPSQCTLSFDVDGDEDIEVGDDYDGLDDDPGDDGLCNPIYGPGGSIIPCSASASGANASVPATGASNSIQSGTASSASPTGFITPSNGPNTTIGVNTTTGSSSQQPSTPISTASSTPPAISSTAPPLPPPPPPPSSTTSSPPPPPPPPSTPLAPPAPSQTSSNDKGSSLCSSIGGTTCKIAYSQYNDTYLYTAYTSYILPSGDNSIVNDLFPLYANDGCTAMFKCDSEADYAVGMTGAQIKAAFDYLFENDSVKICGSSYLSNGCHVTVNGCDNCKPSVPCGSLNAENIANKFPCYN